MSGILRLLRGSPWLIAGSACAWGAAIYLVARIGEAETLAIVIPPAAVATIPLLTGKRRELLAGASVAIALALWGVVGITLLATYFLPSTLLIALGTVWSWLRKRRSSSEA